MGPVDGREKSRGITVLREDRNPERSDKIGAAGRWPEAIHELVSCQAWRSPQAVAITAGCKSLTYLDLESRANRLAHHLRSLGVGPEIIVALCIERSISQVVGALAILKAGGAYLPLDPSYPTERLKFVLEDSKAAFLLTEDHLAERLSGSKCRVVTVNGTDRIQIECQSPEMPATATRRENLAYVIYTSGSTGTPKGVEITHENLVNLVQWHQDAFHVTSEDRATYLAGLGFDASVWELWPYLTAGASVHLPEESLRTDPESLRRWLVRHEITISFVPTPLAERLSALSWPSSTSLRILLTGGDVLHRFPPPGLPFTLVNNYGPTECTVVATSGVVPARTKSSGRPTIGRPIANTRIYVLDENLERVPGDAPGELFIGGAGVGRGYLNHPELSAQKFLPDPFDSGRGARMYRSGDVVRLLGDGQIEFLGRVDDQIKIRGHRIEPNEITSVLAENPAVQQSVVVTRELQDGEKSLVGYIVLVPGANVSAGELKSAIRNRLPEYMVPAVFVQLESMPVTQNGKIDRAILPPVTATNTLAESAFVAPRTPVEERVAEILAQLLGLERVGVEDNFFMLGGHSLLGTQLILRLRGTFGIELSLRTIFEAPTVTELAARVESSLIARLEAMSEEEAHRILEAPADGLLGAA
jgi:amino acid adenylation domain-containing protein